MCLVRGWVEVTKVATGVVSKTTLQPSALSRVQSAIDVANKVTFSLFVDRVARIPGHFRGERNLAMAMAKVGVNQCAMCNFNCRPSLTPKPTMHSTTLQP